MANKSKNKINQPPNGEGKNQSPVMGDDVKLRKRSEVLQAQRGHPELNTGTEDESPGETNPRTNPNHPKAGR
jgi:hypothetical protein